MKFFLFILGASFTLSLGCGDDEEDPLSSAAGFCDEWSRATCNADIVQSCDADEESDCLVAASEFCGEKVTPRAYGGEGATECLDAVRAAFLDGELDLEEHDLAFSLQGECSRILSGDGREGDECDETSDCDRSEDLECVVKDGEGTCVIPVVQGGGESCDEPELVCEDNLFCDGSNCLVRAGEEDDCDDDNPCGEGLRCDDDVCVPKLDARDDCTTNDDCASGLCEVGSDGEDGECANIIQLVARSPLCAYFR